MIIDFIYRSLFLSTFMFLYLGDISGQSTDSINNNVKLVEFTIDLNNPLRTYGDNLSKNPIGVSISYLDQTSSKAYSMMGFELSYYSLGSLSATISNGGFDDFNDRTGSNALTLKFLYRFYTPFYFKIIEPFIEVGLGPHIYYTQTTTTFLQDDTSEFNLDQTDFGITYSASFGASIKIVQNVFGLVKVSYSSGNSTSVLIPSENIFTEFPVDSFRSFTIQPNLFKIQFGVSVAF